MLTDQIKNKHLYYLLEHAKLYVDDDEEIPGDLLLHIIGELKVSNLLIPAVEEDDEIVFENVLFEDDDTSYLPLFTSLEEFEKHISDSEFEALDNDFDLYIDIVRESDLDGIIINMEGLNFELDKEFISGIPYGRPETAQEDTTAYTASQLKEIFENTKNEDFVKFIKSEWKGDDMESIMVELSNSCLLNAVISDESLDEFANDGIIRYDDVDGFNLYIIEDDEIHLAMVFTSKQEMEKTLSDTEGHYYGQITLLNDLFDFVLNNDMDGIVINPSTENRFILREEIISQARGIELIAEDERFRDALDYAFII